jgi:tetratricopeptide (TPR) repeat protein
MLCPRTPSRSSRTSAFATTAGLLAALALCCLTARAQAADPDQEAAREHHRAADTAFKAGRYDEAYREWEEGYRLSSRPLFLLNMAHADRKRGDLRGARALYKRYLVMEPQTKLRAEVEEVLAQIEEALAAEDAATPTAAAAVEPPAALPPSAAALAVEPEPEIGPNLVAHSGPAPAARPPFYKKWWFWTGAGAAVVLGVVTGALLLRGDSYTKSGSLGTVGTGP